jgi:hypothetical protein
MPGYPDAPFPARPFYSCDDHGLAVIDQADMSQLLRGGNVDAWMRLETGPRNVIDGTPLKVEDQAGARVTVRCGTGTIEIDFEEETVKKTDENGRVYVYMGPLDEANEGNGWMPLR